MGTNEQSLIIQQHRWSLELKSGEKIPLPPRGKKGVQPLCVTDVFLVDLENAATQGVMAVCIETTTRNRRMLTLLSAERPCVELQSPVVLDEELCFYLMRLEGHSDDAVIQIEGFMLPSVPSPDTNDELEEQEEGDEEAASSEDDDDTSDKDYEEGDDESDDEVDGDHVRPVTSGKHGISPGWFRPSVPVAQPGLTNRDWSPIFSPGCYTNRD
jgi:hypothetical protein